MVYNGQWCSRDHPARGPWDLTKHSMLGRLLPVGTVSLSRSTLGPHDPTRCLVPHHYYHCHHHHNNSNNRYCVLSTYLVPGAVLATTFTFVISFSHSRNPIREVLYYPHMREGEMKLSIFPRITQVVNDGVVYWTWTPASDPSPQPLYHSPVILECVPLPADNQRQGQMPWHFHVLSPTKCI